MISLLNLVVKFLKKKHEFSCEVFEKKNHKQQQTNYMVQILVCLQN